MPFKRRFKDKYAGSPSERICCLNYVRLVLCVGLMIALLHSFIYSFIYSFIHSFLRPFLPPFLPSFFPFFLLSIPLLVGLQSDGHGAERGVGRV